MPLSFAAWKGDTSCIALLLDAGALLEAQNRCAARHRPVTARLSDSWLAHSFLCRDGRTPLANAANAGQSEAVALLLERGANANSLDRLGHSALSDAVVCKHIRCCCHAPT